MSILLDVMIGVVILALGTLGVWRGVYRGMFTLGGTLLAAVMVDIWQGPWNAWLADTFSPERPAVLSWTVTVLIFLALALLIGYGNGMLLPKQAAETAPTLRERLMGALVGALNGALLVGYVLYYGSGLPDTHFVPQAVQAAVLAPIMALWLPWFILVLVLSLAGFIFGRIVVKQVRIYRKRRSIAAARAAAEKPQPPHEEPSASLSKPGEEQPAQQAGAPPAEILTSAPASPVETPQPVVMEQSAEQAPEPARAQQAEQPAAVPAEQSEPQHVAAPESATPPPLVTPPVGEPARAQQTDEPEQAPDAPAPPTRVLQENVETDEAATAGTGEQPAAQPAPAAAQPPAGEGEEQPPAAAQPPAGEEQPAAGDEQPPAGEKPPEGEEQPPKQQP